MTCAHGSTCIRVIIIIRSICWGGAHMQTVNLLGDTSEIYNGKSHAAKKNLSM